MRKSFKILLALLVSCALIYFIGRHFADRRVDTANVRADASFFVLSLMIGNKKNTLMHLSRASIGSDELTQKIVQSLDKLKATDFETAALDFSRGGDGKLATFTCEGGVQFTWTSKDGQFWRIHDLSE